MHDVVLGRMGGEHAALDAGAQIHREQPVAGRAGDQRLLPAHRDRMRVADACQQVRLPQPQIAVEPDQARRPRLDADEHAIAQASEAGRTGIGVGEHELVAVQPREAAEIVANHPKAIA